IKQKKNDIETHKAAIKKYSEQQKDVRNNREFNSLAKEIEFQELEIELAEKNIKELGVNVEFKKKSIDETTEKIAFKQEHLAHKEGELNNILAETEKEEEFLLKKSEDFTKKIDDRLLQAYQRIRKGVRNRSEEHTSELQSRENLVCRLLLEKKKKKKKTKKETQ